MGRPGPATPLHLFVVVNHGGAFRGGAILVDHASVTGQAQRFTGVRCLPRDRAEPLEQPARPQVPCEAQESRGKAAFDGRTEITDGFPWCPLAALPAFAVANAGHSNRFSCPQFDSLAMMVLCNIKITSFTVLFRHARARGRPWRHTTTSLPSSCSLLLYKARSCALGVAPFPGNNARRRLEPPQSFPSVPHFARVRARPTSRVLRPHRTRSLVPGQYMRAQLAHSAVQGIVDTNIDPPTLVCVVHR